MRRFWFVFSLLLLTSAAEADFPIIRDIVGYNDTSSVTTRPIPNLVWSAVGDLLLVFVSMDGADTITFPTASYCTGNAFTVFQTTTPDGTNSVDMGAAYCVLDEVMAGTPAITSGAVQRGSILVFAIVKDSFTGVPTGATPVSSTATAVIDPPAAPSFGGATDAMWFVFTASDVSAGRLAGTTGSHDTTWSRMAGTAGVDTTAAGIVVSWKLANATSIDPGNNVVVLGAAEDAITNTYSLAGQAIPASSGGGGPKIFGALSFGFLVMLWLGSLGLIEWRKRQCMRG